MSLTITLLPPRGEPAPSGWLRLNLPFFVFEKCLSVFYPEFTAVLSDSQALHCFVQRSGLDV